MAVAVDVHPGRRSQFRRQHAGRDARARRSRRRTRRSISSTACSAGARHENRAPRVLSVLLACAAAARAADSHRVRARRRHRARRRACAPGSAYRSPRRPFASCAGSRRSRCAAWNGVLHADRPAPMCLQALRSRTMNHYFGNEATSEDCLYLNVWAPPSGERLPVIVWIYGGGFNVGSASMANYSGEDLARERRGARESRLPPRRARFPRAPGAHARIGLRRLGQLRAHGSDRRPAMGAAQHRGVRRRSGQRDDRRAIGGLDGGRAAASEPRGARACSTKPSA